MDKQEDGSGNVRLNDRLGAGLLLDVNCTKFFDIETNASTVRILFSFSDESVSGIVTGKQIGRAHV